MRGRNNRLVNTFFPFLNKFNTLILCVLISDAKLQPTVELTKYSGLKNVKGNVKNYSLLFFSSYWGNPLVSDFKIFLCSLLTILDCGVCLAEVKVPRGVPVSTLTVCLVLGDGVNPPVVVVEEQGSVQKPNLLAVNLVMV